MSIEEKKDNFLNIKTINKIVKGDENIASSLKDTKSKLKSILKTIDEKTRAILNSKKQEEVKAVEDVIQTENEIVKETSSKNQEKIVPEENVVQEVEVKETITKQEVEKVVENKETTKNNEVAQTKEVNEPVLKSNNPNIAIVNGKRVYVPTPPKKREYINKEELKNKGQGDRKPFQKGDKPKSQNGTFVKKEFSNQNQQDKRTNAKSPLDKKSFTPSFDSAPNTYIPKENKQQNKNRSNEKNNYEDRKAINKKSLMKGQVSMDDFDESKTGYRKLRKGKDKNKENAVSTIKIEKAVINKEIIQIKELSELIGIQAIEITKLLFKEGILKTINDSIDYDTAGFIAAGLGIELELKLDKTYEDVLEEGFNEEKEDESKLIKRPPIVTVMGHVDHGKTSLLDYIRNANVTSGEAGGITQHIGAYTVSINNQQITFLDTPGHAAFTAMRARGASITDIAVIVVAADDGIMPQTIEAINHAKAAGVTIIIAANKIDKPTADIERVKKGLADQEVLVEEWGGDIALVPVSAKTGQGVDDLLETIILTADIKELKANPDRMAKGVIVEAKLDKGKGPMATVLVQSGTLKVGDYLVAGTITGKVRAMLDDKGRNVKTAGPSVPVSILGLESVPNAGDSIFAVEEAKLSTLVASERKNKEREDMIREQQKVSLDDLFSKVSSGDLKTLNLIVKADVQGSVEAVKQSLIELSNEEVKVNVVHAAVGAISETDVSLADSSNSIIIGFNVRPDSKAKALSEQSKIDVKLYRVIYEAIEDIKKALKGMLAPKLDDVYLGKAEVRETFKISNVGMVAGCYVVDGKILRSGKLRIYRDDVMICEGNVKQLKRFKDDVKEVAQGYECGMSIENFDGIKVGDFIECYTVQERKD